MNTPSDKVVDIKEFAKSREALNPASPTDKELTQKEIDEYSVLIGECQVYFDYLPQEERDRLCKLLMSFSMAMIQDCYNRLKELDEE